MTVLRRCGLALGLVGLGYGGLGPWLSGQIDELRIARSAPLQTQEVRKKIALLPAEAQKSTAVMQMQAALVLDGQLNTGEQRWSRSIGMLLSTSQREQGLAMADLTSPSPPPPMEATGVDGDLCHLADVLLQNYGYTGVEAAESPAQDPWVGVDRRSRTRVLVALATQRALEPAQAQQILSVTFQLLHDQIRRSENRETIKALLPIAMGEG